jgi:hypothetical protein
MTEDDWLACRDPAPMLRFVAAAAGGRKLRLFGVACCRMVLGRLADERSVRAVLASEAFADRIITEHRLEMAFLRADKAADASPGAAANAACCVAENAIDFDCWNVAWTVALALGDEVDSPGWCAALLGQAALLRCVVGNPFRPVNADPAWLTSAAVGLAEGIYADRAWDRLPILADALEDAGCDDADVLGHCRGPGPHARGCWVVDLVLGQR